MKANQVYVTPQTNYIAIKGEKVCILLSAANTNGFWFPPLVSLAPFA